MYFYVLTLHVLTVMSVIGTLSVQSLTVVLRLLLSDPEKIKCSQWFQYRVHQQIYYPIMVVAIFFGAYQVLFQEGLTITGNGLHAKIILLLI